MLIKSFYYDKGVRRNFDNYNIIVVLIVTKYYLMM